MIAEHRVSKRDKLKASSFGNLSADPKPHKRLGQQ